MLPELSLLGIMGEGKEEGKGGGGGTGNASKAGCYGMAVQRLQGHMEPLGSLPQKRAKLTLGIRRLGREERGSVLSPSAPPGILN